MNSKLGLNNIPGISVLDYSGPGDPLKVTIQSRCTLSGFQLQKIFEDVGIYAELADLDNLLLVLPLLREKQPFPFCEALETINAALIDVSVRPSAEPEVTSGKQKISSLAISFKEMTKKKAVNIIITEAAGKIAAETVIHTRRGFRSF